MSGMYVNSEAHIGGTLVWNGIGLIFGTAAFGEATQ